jgi:transposase-like protein
MTGRELRDEVRRCGARRRGRRFPADLRARLQSTTRARWSAGESAAQIAVALGISAETVRRWCEDAHGRSAALVPVQVVEERLPSREVRLISPRGWKLEGLDLQSALAVLQRLG